MLLVPELYTILLFVNPGGTHLQYPEQSPQGSTRIPVSPKAVVLDYVQALLEIRDVGR